MVLRLTRLTLTDFRNYAALTWHPAARISVLYGPNGSGKTNLLEAVSLLVPGRGLRTARNADLPRQTAGGESPPAWGIAARFRTAEGEVDIGTGGPPDGSSDRRVFRLDGAPPRSQADIVRRIAAVWLTPRMDRLFLDGLSGRRRFLDRLVWALEPGHAREMAAHDTAIGNRNRLLAGGRHDRAWLAGLEDAIARHAVAATAARLNLVRRLNDQSIGRFPSAHIALACPIAERMTCEPALAVEDWLRANLEASRTRDEATGTTALGAHRTDMVLTDAGAGVAAALASTGQQKALLIGVVLSHAALITAMRGFAPLLLLDEPAVHLDKDRRTALWQALADLPAQTLVTGTDSETFLPLAEQAEAFATGDRMLRPDRRFLMPLEATAPVPQPL
jgi:DNA replication and repair protein RecF